MSQIRPDEVSSILKDQINGFNSAASLEEVGTVLQVGDGIARIYGLFGVQSGELVEFENGVRAVVLNLEEDNVGAVLMGSSTDIKEGDKVKRTNHEEWRLALEKNPNIDFYQDSVTNITTRNGKVTGVVCGMPV